MRSLATTVACTSQTPRKDRILDSTSSLRGGVPVCLTCHALAPTVSVEARRFFAWAKHSPLAPWVLTGIAVIEGADAASFGVVSVLGRIATDAAEVAIVGHVFQVHVPLLLAKEND